MGGVTGNPCYPMQVWKRYRPGRQEAWAVGEVRRSSISLALGYGKGRRRSQSCDATGGPCVHLFCGCAVSLRSGGRTVGPAGDDRGIGT
jgi:hypothetical protein